MTPLLLPVCLIAAVPGPAKPGAEATPPAVRVTLIDGSLRTQTVELVQLDAPARAGQPARCVFIDAAGARVTLTTADDPARFPLAIAPDDRTFTDPAAPEPPTAPPARLQPRQNAQVIELVDGQRLIGSLAAPPPSGPDSPPGDDQSLRWNHPRLGLQTIPLERVHALRLSAPATPGALRAVERQESLSGVPESDIVLLTNGDRLTGFVDRIGGPSGEVVVTPPPSPGSKPQPVHVSLAQAAYIALANPTVRPAGIVLWLSDGSVVATDRLGFDAAAGRVTLGALLSAPATPSPGASLDPGDVRAVALDASRLTPLASLGIARSAPTGDRRIAEPARIVPLSEGAPSPLGADDILLPGPMLVEWELPAGATRLAGWVTLDPSARSWGDCTVSFGVIEPGQSEPAATLARQSVSADQPVMPVNIDLPGLPGKARLRVTVDAGPSGPIQDRVWLRRMLIVSGPAPR